MSYLLKLPSLMRVFALTNPESSALCRTGGSLFEGETVKVVGVDIKSYDNEEKLVLKLADNGKYVFVEELDDDIAALAYQWIELHSEATCGPSEHAREMAGLSLENLRQEMAPLMRKYIRPELSVVGDAPVAALDSYGPGIHPVLW